MPRAIKFGNCDRGQFRNIFEAEQLASANRGRRAGRRDEVLRVTGFVAPACGVATSTPVRANIAAANAFFQIGSPDGAAADEATPELFTKMKPPIRER